ncbi:nucleoside triphosphate pyrophosphohydrolase [Chloroflexota bacterium]
MSDEINSTTKFTELKSIIAQLRSSKGCPWDRQQTHESLRPFIVEECYEVLQAIEDGIPQKLCEELGDLLLQIMLQAQIAAESGQFTVEDVVQGISDKLIHRHPHVFGDVEVKDAIEVRHNWEALKNAERQGDGSLLDSVPRNMPALSYSQSIQRRVASVGFDWEKTEDILEKLAEEVSEILKAPDKEERANEFGDLLFVLVNIARRMDIDPDASLSGANRRFYNRFTCMEKICRQRGVGFNDLSFNEQNALWTEAKKEVG